MSKKRNAIMMLLLLYCIIIIIILIIDILNKCDDVAKVKRTYNTGLFAEYCSLFAISYRCVNVIGEVLDFTD